jgi:NAD(P)-dependent dehydrogenase (short-subunit alcohol dehydrogenase family)
MFATMSRTVPVTGAGSGIGAAIGRAFAQQGDRVSACHTSAERLNLVLGELSDRARGTVVDVSNEEDIRAAVRSEHEQKGSGRIINMGSISTFSGRANGVAYTVAKAAAAVFLASDPASYINGVALPVDGGLPAG